MSNQNLQIEEGQRTQWTKEKWRNQKQRSTKHVDDQGRIQGEAHPACVPPKIGKNMIFHRKYPKNFRTSLRSVQFFLSAPPPLIWNPGPALDDVHIKTKDRVTQKLGVNSGAEFLLL
jgi:hypothetical protein